MTSKEEIIAKILVNGVYFFYELLGYFWAEESFFQFLFSEILNLIINHSEMFSTKLTDQWYPKIWSS